MHDRKLMDGEVRNYLDALTLYHMFIEGADKEGRIDDVTMTHMGDYFDTVDVDNRADVFIEFMSLLDKNKVKYDASQFNL